MASSIEAFLQHPELFEVDTKSRLKDRKSPSRNSQPKVLPSSGLLLADLLQISPLESQGKVQVMENEYLVHQVLKLFEEYAKQKKNTQPIASYLVSSILKEAKPYQSETLRKSLQSIALSVVYHAPNSREIAFYYNVFDEKEPNTRVIQSYLHCRKVVENFLYPKKLNDKTKLSLDNWTTLLKKIFSKHPTDAIFQGVREKIVADNKQRAYQVLNNKGSGDKKERQFDLALSLKAQKLEVNAIDFILFCVEEFQKIKGDGSPRKGGPVENSNSHTMSGGSSPNKSPSKYQKNNGFEKEISSALAYEKIFSREEMENLKEDQRPLLDPINMVKENKIEKLVQENAELNEELTLSTAEKDVALKTLEDTNRLYGDLVKDHFKVNSFLRQMRKDLKFMLSKLEKVEPNIYRDLDHSWIGKLVSSRIGESNTDKAEDDTESDEEANLKQTPALFQMKSGSLLTEDFCPKIFSQGSESAQEASMLIKSPRLVQSELKPSSEIDNQNKVSLNKDDKLGATTQVANALEKSWTVDRLSPLDFPQSGGIESPLYIKNINNTSESLDASLSLSETVNILEAESRTGRAVDKKTIKFASNRVSPSHIQKDSTGNILSRREKGMTL